MWRFRDEPWGRVDRVGKDRAAGSALHFGLQEVPLRAPRCLAAAAAALISVAPSAQQATNPPTASPTPRLDQYKRDVGQEVDGLGEMIQRMNDQVFSFAELGFQE